MKKSKTRIAKIIEGALREAFVVLQGLGQKEGGRMIGSGEAFGDLDDDIEIQADFLLGQAIADFLREKKVNCRLQIEGQKEMLLGPSPAEYYIAVDPLDGSLNFAKRGKTLGLPFSCSITAFSLVGDKCCFKDVEAAGCIDLRSKDLWLAEKGNGCFLNGNPCHTSGITRMDIRKGIIIGEMYYPENRELLCQIFRGEKGWLRNPGSSAYEMSLVASGQVDAYICDRQKLDILGMAYLIVKEAGGSVIDFDGNDLGKKEYIFHSQTPVVLSATESLSSEILARIKQK